VLRVLAADDIHILLLPSYALVVFSGSPYLDRGFIPTLQPSQSFLTDVLTFIPLVCPIALKPTKVAFSSVVRRRITGEEMIEGLLDVAMVRMGCVDANEGRTKVDSVGAAREESILAAIKRI
jgi:hypothetical protein